MGIYIVVIDRSPHTVAAVRTVLETGGFTLAMWPRDAHATWMPDGLPDLVLLGTHSADPREGVADWASLSPDAVLQHVPIVMCASDHEAFGGIMESLPHEGGLMLPPPFNPAALLRLLDALNLTSPRKAESGEASPLPGTVKPLYPRASREAVLSRLFGSSLASR